MHLGKAAMLLLFLYLSLIYECIRCDSQERTKIKSIESETTFTDKAAGESKQWEAPHFLSSSKRADGGVHARGWSLPYTYMDAIKQEKCIIKQMI